MNAYKKLVCLILFFSFLFVGCQGQTSESLLQTGLDFVQAGNHDGAIVCFKNALEKDANFTEARYQLALAYLKTGKFERAENEFQKVIRQNPSYPRLPLEMAELYLYTGRIDQALEATERWISTQGKDPDVLDLQGRAYAASKDYSAAENAFESAIRLDPEYLSAHLHLAALYLETGRRGEAADLLSRLIEENPDNKSARALMAGMEMDAGREESALQQYARLAEIDPSDPEVLYMSGFLHLHLGDRAQAGEIARVMNERFPKHHLALILKGLTLYRDGNYEGASLEFQKVAGIRSDLTAFYFLGMSYYHLGNLELALSEMQRVLDQRPAAVQPRIMSAMILLQQRRIEDAVGEALIALQNDPQSGLVHSVLGSAYMAQGKYDMAMARLNRATELDPGLADAHLKKGVFNLAGGDIELGENELVQALSIAPEILDARLILANHYLRQKNTQDALTTLEEGLRGEPKDAVLYNIMAGAHFSRGNPEEAIEALWAAKKADPDFFTPYFNLASYFIATGEAAKASAEYKSVLQREPANVRALIAAGELAELQKKEAEALSLYERARETGAADGFLALATYHLKKGEAEKTQSLLDAGLKQHPESPQLVEFNGKLLNRFGRSDEAIEAFRKLEKLSSGRGNSFLVQIHLQRKEREKAEEVAREVINDNSRNPLGYVLQAGIHETYGERKQALQVLEGARGRLKGDPQLEMQIARLQEKAGDREGAMKTYRNLVQAKPRFHPAVFAQALLQENAGNRREALKLYEEVLRIEENFTPALNNLAYLYAEHDNPEKGLSLAFKAFRNEPGRPEIMDTLGYLLLRNGRAPEALTVLEKAAELLPDSPTVLYHLGLAYKETGEVGKARETLLKSLEFGDFPESRQSRSLLAQWE